MPMPSLCANAVHRTAPRRTPHGRQPATAWRCKQRPAALGPGAERSRVSGVVAVDALTAEARAVLGPMPTSTLSGDGPAGKSRCCSASAGRVHAKVRSATCRESDDEARSTHNARREDTGNTLAGSSLLPVWVAPALAVARRSGAALRSAQRATTTSVTASTPTGVAVPHSRNSAHT
ncbi:hypothetical protein ERJ75_001130400 [Trypanosoma vivax]|nr:hypothetical protein ERJ75_001130400 [Trypanosoma vivax]